MRNIYRGYYQAPSYNMAETKLNALIEELRQLEWPQMELILNAVSSALNNSFSTDDMISTEEISGGNILINSPLLSNPYILTKKSSDGGKGTAYLLEEFLKKKINCGNLSPEEFCEFKALVERDFFND